jgi:hypothetical protein
MLSNVHLKSLRVVIVVILENMIILVFLNVRLVLHVVTAIPVAILGVLTHLMLMPMLTLSLLLLIQLLLNLLMIPMMTITMNLRLLLEVIRLLVISSLDLPHHIYLLLL